MNKKLGLFLLGAASLAFVKMATTPAQAAGAVDLQQAQQTSLTVTVAQDTAGAQKFVDDMAQRGINFLSNPNLSAEDRKGEFRKLLRSSFDVKTIGRFVLGTYWRTSTPAQQTEYQKLFERLIVNVYANRFGEYQGQKLEVRGARPDGTNDVIVSSFIVPAKGGEEIQVDWRVRNKGNGHKVIDVIVAGVSMAMTQRSDFASVIQRGGGDVNVLLEHLRNS